MGVLSMFGKVIKDRIPSGIHYRLPWPITTIEKPKVTAIKRMSIGFKLAEQLQGIKSSREERERLTGDANVINLSMMVQYTVRDPAIYLYNAETPDFLLRKAGEAFLCEKVGRIPVDELLTVAKAEIEQHIRSSLQVFCNNFNTGLQITSCNLQTVEPPAEVIEAFNEVSRARADKEKIINEAHSYRSELLPAARGRAQEITQTAEAQAAGRISRAEGETDRFNKLLVEYQRNPQVLRQRLFWDCVQVILTDARKIIIEDKVNRETSVRIIVPPPGNP